MRAASAGGAMTNDTGLRLLIAGLQGKQVKLPGDRVQDSITVARILALIDLVSFLLETPEKIQTAVAVVTDPNFGSESGTKGGRHDHVADMDQPWPDQYLTWNLIPKLWIWSWLGRVCKVLDAAMAERIEAASKTGCRELLEFATGVRENHKVPLALRNKHLMLKFLTARYESLGSRLSDDRMKNLVMANGKLAWHMHGCFRLAAPDESSRATQIIHSSGASLQGVEENFCMQTSTVIQKNFRDVGACVNIGRQTIVLANEFPNGLEKYVSVSTNEMIKTEATELKRKWDEDQEQRKPQDFVPQSFVEVVSKKRKGPPTEKAKASLTT